MKKTWLAASLVMGLFAFAFVAQMYAQEPDHSMHGMEPKTQKNSSDKARCAYDGMMMKTSAMVPMKHGAETLYFCNEEQKAVFQKSPKRYLKNIAMGDLHVLMNVMTMKEHMDMMKSMGMGKMAKMGGPNDTHWISVYLAAGQPVELSGVAVKIASPDGKVEFQELKYDKMMKTYAGNVSLLDSGEHKLSLLLESPGIVIP